MRLYMDEVSTFV